MLDFWLLVQKVETYDYTCLIATQRVLEFLGRVFQIDTFCIAFIDFHTIKANFEEF